MQKTISGLIFLIPVAVGLVWMAGCTGITPAGPEGPALCLTAMTLQPADLTSEYRVLEQIARSPEEIDSGELALGWTDGYSITFFLPAANASEDTFVRQSLSRYPEESMGTVLTQLEEGLARQFTLEPLPGFIQDDSHKAYRLTPRENPSQSLSMVLLYKGEIFEQIIMAGPHEDPVLLKALAQRAEEKIPDQ
jgi:hypothetical protein